MSKPLQEIQLENFRAFRGEGFKLPVEGKNILIYGENGSGKTSIWTALDAMFGTALTPVLPEEGEDTQLAESRSRQAFIPHRYLWFNEETDARVRLVLEGFLPFEWSANATPRSPQVQGHQSFVAAAKTRACLDYRGLWETYFLQRDGNTVDIWPLVLTLLGDAELLSGSSLQARWDVFAPLWHKPTKVSNEQTLIDARRDFKIDLKQSMQEVLVEAREILKALDESIGIRLLPFEPDYKVERGKTIYSATKPRIFLRVRLNGRKIPNHHNLLNEARLSALAIAIYLGAAKVREKQSNATLKLLALDDVLIGLDMSHRLPMLKVLDKFFGDWQIFLFTYDRAWYELAKSRLDKDGWKKFEFYASGEVPVWGEDPGALDKSKIYLHAARQLLVPDYKAAGVWARSAFEWMLKDFLSKHHIPVPYCLNEKDLKAETLWQTLKQVQVEVIKKNGVPPEKKMLVSAEIGEGVNRCKAQHLNPLCHANLNLFNAAEIEESIKALGILQNELDRQFHSVSLPPQIEIEVEVPVAPSDPSLSDEALNDLKKDIGRILKERQEERKAKEAGTPN